MARKRKMKSQTLMSGLLALGIIVLCSSSAHAQSHTGSQDVQIYAGEMFGDRLTEIPLTGGFPRLDDAAVFGGRYTYDLTSRWSLQLSAGYSPGRATHVVYGSRDFGITTLDLDVLWNVVPGLAFGHHTFVPYTEVGVGYAWGNLAHTLNGAIGTTQVALTDSDGYTANAGIGAKYYLTPSFFVDLDARYRYLDRLINHYGQALNTGEATLSLGYQF